MPKVENQRPSSLPEGNIDPTRAVTSLANGAGTGSATEPVDIFISEDREDTPDTPDTLEVAREGNGVAHGASLPHVAALLQRAPATATFAVNHSDILRRVGILLSDYLKVTDADVKLADDTLRGLQYANGADGSEEDFTIDNARLTTTITTTAAEATATMGRTTAPIEMATARRFVVLAVVYQVLREQHSTIETATRLIHFIRNTGLHWMLPVNGQVVAAVEPSTAGAVALLDGIETAVVATDYEAPSGAWAALKHGVATLAGWAVYEGLGTASSVSAQVGLKPVAKAVGNLREAWRFPLTDTVYTKEEQYALAWSYLPAKLKVADVFYGLYRSLKRNTFPIPDVTQGPQPVPEELHLNDPITREETLRIMDRFLSTDGRQQTKLNPAVTARLREAYVFNEYTREQAPEFHAKKNNPICGPKGPSFSRYKHILLRAEDFARGYQTFLLEDAWRATELYRSDVPFNEGTKEATYVRALEAYHAVRLNEEPVESEVFAALRDLNDARQWMDLSQFPEESQAHRYALDLREAETALGRLREEGTRDRVRRSMNFLAEVAGLGTSSETFIDLSLPAAGLGLRPQVLAYAMSQHPALDKLASPIITTHDELHKAQNALRRLEQERKGALALAKKERGKVAEVTKNYELQFLTANKNFQQAQILYEEAMRVFLDTPGNARLLQGELVRYNAAREVLFHSHHIMRQVMPELAVISAERRDYNQAWQDYERVQQEAVNSHGADNHVGIKTLKAEEALNRAEKILLDSNGGVTVIRNLLQFLDENRPHVIGLDSALQANADYWRAERQWARKEVARQEIRLPEEIDYLVWRDGQIGNQIILETTLMFDAAEQMMATARSAGKVGRDIARMYDEAMTKRDATLERLGLENERRAEHWERVADSTLVLEMEATGEEVPLGHSISWNRSMEAVHVQAAKAYNAAARAYAAATGKPRPRPVSLTATALHEKLFPNLNPATHAERADNLITRFLGEHVLPSLMHGLWVIQNKLPARLIDPIIYQWGLRVNRDFHLVKVEDRRHAERLPGTKDVADMAHNGGWYIDYSTSLVVSPEGEIYVLMSKNDLGDKLPPGMAEGIGLLAQLLPENPDQAVNEGVIVDTSIDGLHTDFNRHGGQNVVVYGALTMGAVTQPQVVAVNDPRFLLDPQYTTGLELAGVSRPAQIVRERIAIQGTVTRTRGVRSMTHRGHNAGPKPDQPFGATPTEAHVVVEEEPVLARPRGTKLLDKGEPLPDWTRRHAAEVAHLMAKRGASLEFAARELRKCPNARTSARAHHGRSDRSRFRVPTHHGSATTSHSLAHSAVSMVAAPGVGVASAIEAMVLK